MYHEMDDLEFERHVRLVCHTMAYRKYRRDNPGVSQSEAWAHAVDRWEDYVDAAIDFLSAQLLHREGGTTTCPPEN